MSRVGRPARFWLAALTCLSITLSARADAPPTLRVTGPVKGLEIGKQLAYLEDPDASFTIAEFATGRRTIQGQQERVVPNFGFSRSAYWFEAHVENATRRDLRLLFEIDYPVLDEVDFYAVSASGRVLDHVATGSLRPFADRRLLHRNFLFPVGLATAETLRVIVRVRSSVAVQIPLRLWSEHHFIEADQWAAVLQGIYVGFMLVMVLYNLFLYFSVRERMYLLYVPMVCGQLAFQYALHGLAFATLWPEHVAFNRALPPMVIPFVTWAANAFAMEFLDLRRREPGFYRITRGVRLLCLVDAAIAPFLPFDVGVALGCVLAAVASSTVLIAFALLARTAPRQVATLGIAWTPLLTGVFALVMEKFGWIGRSFWTENLVQIGSAIEVVVLSIALGDRINHERDEKLRAQERALDHERAAQRAQQDALSIQRRANDTLEQRVKERTHELAEANARLADLSTRDALTSLRNRRHFNERFYDEFARAVRENTPLSVLMIDIDHFKEVNDSFGHLVGDQCLTAIADVLRVTISRATDTVARYGGEEFVILLPNTDADGARKVAEAVRLAVEALAIEASGELIRLSVSVGVMSGIPARNARRELFLSRADVALYEAKQRGRNRVHLLDAG